MKKFLIILSFFLALAFSCVSEKKKTDKNRPVYYIEKELSFFNPYEPFYTNGKYQGYIYEKWLRQPKNLRMVHETLKKVGYERLISDYDLRSNPCLLWGYVNRPLNHIIDSLLITYPLDTIETKYYREFWQRRKSESNDEIVFEILKELSKILLNNELVHYESDLVNDTLYNLLVIDHLHRNPTKEQAHKAFEYLKSIGMHGSAYNLLFENMNYQDVDWNEMELVLELKTDSIECCPQTWIMDDTK